MKDKSNHLQMLFYTDLIDYNPPFHSYKGFPAISGPN